jgi:hypothetical protein
MGHPVKLLTTAHGLEKSQISVQTHYELDRQEIVLLKDVSSRNISCDCFIMQTFLSWTVIMEGIVK